MAAATRAPLPFAEDLPAFVTAIRGRLGDVVFKTYRRGARHQIVVTRVPCFVGYVPSAAQRARRDRMREATAYAQRVYADPAAKACYVAAAKQLGRQPFRLAVSDYLAGHARVQATTQAFAPPTAAARNRIRPPRTPEQPSRRGACLRQHARTARNRRSAMRASFPALLLRREPYRESSFRRRPSGESACLGPPTSCAKLDSVAGKNAVEQNAVAVEKQSRRENG